MSNNEFIPVHLNDGYLLASCDSDFEIINNSDSEETELNNCCYQKLNNDKEICNDICKCCNNDCNNDNDDDDGDDDDDEINDDDDDNNDADDDNDVLNHQQIKSTLKHNNCEKNFFDNNLTKCCSLSKNTIQQQYKGNCSEKLILSLSQDQILCVEHQSKVKQYNRNHQNQYQLKQHKLKHQQSSDKLVHQDQQHHKSDRNENDIVNRTRSNTFTIPFTIVPIDISKNNENRCKTEKTNLPEIVLTSFENPLSKFNEKQHQHHQQQQQQKQHQQKSSSGLIGVDGGDNISNSNNTPISISSSSSSRVMGLPTRITPSSSPIIATTPITAKTLFTSAATAAVAAAADATEQKTSAAMTLESHQIQIHGNENSPSPELLLDRTLSNESMHSLSNGSGSGGSNNFIIDTISSTLKKPLDLDTTTLNHQIEGIDILHNSSSANAISGRGLDQLMLHESKEPIPNDLKCRICGQIYRDPRTLNCLHSFCFQCLINENFIKDISIPFWSRPDHKNFDWTSMSNNTNNGGKSNTSNRSVSSYQSSAINSDSPSTFAGGTSRPDSRSSTTSAISKKSNDKQSKDKSSKSSPKKHLQIQQQQQQGTVEKIAIIICTICKFCTEMPIGGIRQLPQNFVLSRKIENVLLKIGNEVISNIWCSLCCAVITASYHCLTCTINLCNFCKQAHERQKSTSDHNIKHLLELRKLRVSQQNSPSNDTQFQQNNIKCSLHPGFDLKSFCITCQQIVCSDCMILLHKGHKCESAHKAFKIYQKAVKDTVDRTKPLCEYATHSISKLETISMKINKKCDQVQNDVETFLNAYFEAIELHRKILLQQVTRARETKIQMILEHQYDMERKATDAKNAVAFCEELLESGSETEILSFVNILLKRFDYCQKFKPLLDPKISDTLHFLPEVRAPSINAQNNIPLYGIITTQIVEPQFCTLETEGYTQLRVHKKIELVIVSRDADDVPLCHGGLTINTQLKYKDTSKLIDTKVSDKRDGTYVISFTPDSPGTMSLTVTIDNKHIKGSPFTLIARTVRPHRGIFHCCTFCSSKGSKTVSCACEGTMPGFKGCGHGHNGHPGRRHWSCCGSILENSECTVANKF